MKKGVLLICTVICGLFCLSMNSVYAQNPNAHAPGVVTGKVLDSATLSPISYVTVTVLKLEDSSLVNGAITKDDGSFVVDGIPIGKYILRCSFIGYGKHYFNSIEITKEKRKFDFGAIKIFPVNVTKNEINVTASKEAISYKLDKKVINPEKILAASGGNATDVLRNVPSVSVDLDGNVSLRGSGSFQILIDGHPTVLKANDVLQQIPAAAIENIEIITNPSAKYDPDGTSGIINIVMKKENYSTTGGMINATLGSSDKYSTDVIFSMKRNDYKFTLGAKYYNQRHLPLSDFTRVLFPSTDSMQTIHQVADRVYKPFGYEVNSGLDYTFDEKNNISLSANVGSWNFDRSFPAKLTTANTSGTVAYSLNKDDYKIDGTYGSFNLNYQKLFEAKGSDLNVNALFSFWDGTHKNTMDNFKTDSLFNPISYNDLRRRSNTDEHEENLRVKAEYVLPISDKSKFEAGGQGDVVWAGADFLLESLDTITNKWQKDLLTNNMDFIQHTYALYATYSDELFGVQCQLGLRGEYYFRKLRQITTNEEYDFDRVNIYPTIHLSKEFPNNHQLQLSYSRRINRPQGRQLNPFPDYIDNNYISRGNPDLKPEMVDSYELNYRKGFENSYISIEAYYKQTNDPMMRVMKLQPDNRILISDDNVDKNFDYGIEINFNTNLWKFLTINAGSNIYNSNIYQTVDGIQSKRNKTIVDGNLSLTFAFSQSTILQATEYYSGKRLMSDGEQKDYFVTNFSIRQDFLNRSLFVTLVAADVFSTGKYEFTNNQRLFSMNGLFKPEQPSFYLTLSYRLNNYVPERNKTEEVDRSAPTGF